MQFVSMNSRCAKSAITVSALLLGLVLLVSTKALWAQTKVTHGPLVGAVTSKSARIVIRTDATATVRFDVATDNTFANALATEADTAEASSACFVIINVDELSANTQYYYRAVVDNVAHSEIRRFKTFPNEGVVESFTFAFGACQQAVGDPHSYIGRVFPLIAQDEPRFFLHLGDWTYPDTTDTPANPTNFFNTDYALVQANYMEKYNPSFPMDALFKVAPIDYVYDDHDFSNNNSDGTYPSRENSLRGYREMFPSYPLANANNGLWHKFTFGNTDFFMVDTRTQRHPNLAAFGQAPSGKLFFQPGAGHDMLQADPTISGELQMDWLIRELQESTATWKFIGTGVPFNPGFSRPALELAVLLQGTALDPVPTPIGPLPAAFLAVEFSDKWGGFPENVARLVKAVNDAEIQNVIILSGDTHTAGLDDGAHSLFPEFMAGGLDRTNSQQVAIAQSFGINAWNRGGQTLAQNNFNSHYGRVSVFGNDSVRVELIDEFGELIASHKQVAGHLASRVGLALAPEGQDFGDVEVGSTSVLPIVCISTSADTVVISNINTTGSDFFVLNPLPIRIPPGEKTILGVFFQPPALGNFLSLITIHSNDPESPFIVPVAGKGKITTAVDDLPGGMPSHYMLLQNHPNPFNPSTTINYGVPKTGEVTLSIYNLRGQLVRTLLTGVVTAGHHQILWDGADERGSRVASGIYVYRMQADGFVATRKLVLTK